MLTLLPPSSNPAREKYTLILSSNLHTILLVALKIVGVNLGILPFENIFMFPRDFQAACYSLLTDRG